MKTVTETITNTVYQSESLPEIRTIIPSLGRVIAWADAHPAAWRIVTGRRSKAFGLGSCEYIGWAQRSTAPEAVLERTRHIHELATEPHRHLNPDSIFVWRAGFTLDHYRDKGFTGGFFQQHDAPMRERKGRAGEQTAIFGFQPRRTGERNSRTGDPKRRMSS